MSQTEVFDLLVVGAGTGGAVASKVAAQKGLSVCLIDRKSSEMIGEKVCGDGIGKHHFDLLGISPPSGDELAVDIQGIDIFSPDRQTIFRIEGEGLQGYVIHRYQFGQRLLREAIDEGVRLRDNFHALAPIIEEGYVCGVRGKDLELGKTSEIRAKVTVDASGHAAVLRKSLPKDFGIDSDVLNSDIQVCYREIRKTEMTIERPEFCQIFLTQRVAPGGYYWIFPKGPHVVNVGLGVQGRDGLTNPKSLLYREVLTQELFRGSKIVHGGGGLVPTRRPLNTIVANGFTLVGDSACQVSPIHGGGMGPSMMAGKLAAEVASGAIARGSFSAEDLWNYNVRYMTSYGAKQALLDVFRIFLQRLDDADLNFGMSQRLIRESDLLKVNQGEELRLSISDLSRRIAAGVREVSLLRKLRYVSRQMKEVKSLYLNYPKKELLAVWALSIENAFEKISQKV